MKINMPTFLLLILALIYPSISKAQIYIASLDHSKVVLSKKDFDDVRIFSGSKTYWFIKKGSLRISSVYDQKGLSKIEIDRFSHQRQIHLKYERTGQKVILTSATSQPIRYFNCIDCSSDAPSLVADADAKQACVQFGTGIDQINLFANQLNADTLSKNTESSVDSSCIDIAIDLQTAMEDAFKMDRSSHQTSLSSCLQNKDNMALFEGIGLSGDQAKIVAAKLELESAKMYAGSVQNKPFITCEEKLPNGSKANTSSDGKIQFSTQSLAGIPQYRRALSEELLHKSGLESEDLVKNILDICLENKKTVAVNMSKNDKTNKENIGESVPTSATEAQAAGTALAAQPAAINQAIANGVPASLAAPPATPDASSNIAANPPPSPTNSSNNATTASSDSGPTSSDSTYYGSSNTKVQIPTSYGLASAGNYNNYDEESATKANDMAASQSNSFVNFAIAATNAMATPIKTPVLAATGSTMAVAATGSTYRAPTAVDNSAMTAPSRGSAVAAAANRGEKNIDVNAIAAAAGVGPEVAGNSLNSAGTDVSGTGSAKPTASLRAPASTSTGLDSLSSSSGPSNHIVNNRQPASTGSTYTPSPEEITTFFVSNDNYKFAKQRLAEPKMQSDLIEARVSIRDMRNNHFGAPESGPPEVKATTHLFDNGRAFVLKKKK